MDWGRVGAGVATGGLSEVGYATGLLGDKPGPDFSSLEGLIKQRRSEIAEYESKLETARNNVLSNYKNLQTATMARFAPALEASLGGRGIPLNSGAFYSGVGAKAAEMQGGYDELNAQMTQQNLQSVEAERAGLLPTEMGLKQQETMIPYQNRMAMQNALGGLVGSAAGYALGGPMGGQVGGQVGRTVVGSPQGQPGPYSGGYQTQDPMMAAMQKYGKY